MFYVVAKQQEQQEMLNSWKTVRVSVSLFFVDDGNTFCTFLNLFVASELIELETS